MKAASGVVVTIGFDGEPEFAYALLGKEDEAALTNTATNENRHSAQLASRSKAQAPSAYSAPLIEPLTTHKTAAIAAELAQQPKIALSALVHVLALNEFGLELGFYRLKSALQITVSQPNLQQAENSPAWKMLEEQRKTWLGRFPKTWNELWQWCLNQDVETLLGLLAYCAARAVNGVKSKADMDGRGRLPHSDALGTALEIEMARWFKPTAENFFYRISKATHCRGHDGSRQTAGRCEGRHEESTICQTRRIRNRADQGLLNPVILSDSQYQVTLLRRYLDSGGGSGHRHAR